MTDVQRCFICLIRNVVIGTNLQNDFEICDLLELYKLSKKHDMAHIVAYGLKKNRLVDLQSEIWKKYYNKQYSLAQFRVMNLCHEFDNLCNVLEESKIDYIPLKGAIIRQLYPESWMRASCDIDVLVHKENLKTTEKVLADTLQYVVNNEKHPNGKDDILKTKSGFVIELHFSLSSEKSFAADYLNTVWEKSVPSSDGKYLYKMDNAIFYFYHIFHAAKHFKSGGCGVKTLLDTWLINHKLDIDRKCCCKQLKKYGLLKFSIMLETISERLFSGIESEEFKKEEEYIFCGGIYGGGNFAAAGQSNVDGNSIKYYTQRLFPSYDFMTDRYRCLKDKPYLLPYYWLKRIATAFGKKDGKRTKAEIKTAWLEKEKSKKIKAMFDELGL